jgi:hypothetical protein
MVSVFLKGLVSVAKNCVDVVYTQNDLKTLPLFHAMPTTFFPYITSMRNVFLDGGDKYQGNADIAVNAGFLNGADLSDAEHGVYYAWSEYRDAFRCYKEENRLENAVKDTKEIQPGVHLGEKALVFDRIRETSGNGDYRTFAEIMDSAMKEWGILPEDTGYVEGRLISDTKEIVFDPDHARFSIHTPYCGYFSGAPEEEISLSDKICVEAENERITLALIAKDEIKMDGASEYILTAMGTTGMDETTFGKGPELMGIPFAAVEFKGKLYAETLEGCIRVKAENAKLEVLNPIGEVIAEMNGEKTGDEIRFAMDGSVPGIQYRLVVGE